MEAGAGASSWGHQGMLSLCFAFVCNLRVQVEKMVQSMQQAILQVQAGMLANQCGPWGGIWK